MIPLPSVYRAPFDGYLGEEFNTADLLEKMLDDPSSGLVAPAAILLETVQGEGGLNVASPVWLNHIAALARNCGALLIVDDVQAGCGRTGTFFSFEPTGGVPDLVVLSKSISGYGLPMALLLIRPGTTCGSQASIMARSAERTRVRHGANRVGEVLYRSEFPT
jgi:diaminobutyrate-2-oxoglutarate transaminase